MWNAWLISGVPVATLGKQMETGEINFHRILHLTQYIENAISTYTQYKDDLQSFLSMYLSDIP